MAASGAAGATGGSPSSGTHAVLHEVLSYVRIASPIGLLIAFVISFVVNSVISAKQLTPHRNNVTSGPGGRPLPKRTRSAMQVVARERPDVSPRFKLVFKWLSVGVLLTFIADAALNMAHAIIARSEHWWRGQAVVVSTTNDTDTPSLQACSC